MDNDNKLIQQQFGANAQSYATSPTHAQGASLARLIELTQPARDWLMLDVSTGAGHTALTFAPHVKGIIAVDLTAEMLEVAGKLARERGVTNIEFRAGDAQSLMFENDTFELVTNRIALHHYADARKAIAEMARVCKSSGIVALVDNIVPPDKVTAGFVNHFEKMRDPSHSWCYPVVRLGGMFADAGLKVEHTETIRKEIEFQPWVERMGANAATQSELRERLFAATGEAKEFLTPRADGDKVFFSLTEAIVIGRKE